MSTSEAPHTPNSTPTSGFSAKFSHTLRSLEAAQKPGIGVPAYTRWVNRRVARYFAAAAVALGITPQRRHRYFRRMFRSRPRRSDYVPAQRWCRYLRCTTLRPRLRPGLC